MLMYFMEYNRLLFLLSMLIIVPCTKMRSEAAEFMD